VIKRPRKTFHESPIRKLLVVLLVFLCNGMLVVHAQAQPSTLYFADIAHGGTTSSYQTTLQLYNSSNQDTTATINLYQDNGTPFSVGLKDASSGNLLTPTTPGVFNLTVPARGLKVLTTSGSQSLQAGWVMVQSSSSLNGNVFFQQVDAAGNLLSQTAVSSSALLSSFTGFVEKSSTVNTGIAVANPSPSTAAQVTLQSTSASGQVVASATVTVPPLQHFARFLDQFPELANFPSGVGTLAVSSSANVTAIFLRSDRGQLTTVPLFTGTILAPTITSLSPSDGAPNTSVTITGTNFYAQDPTKNQVTFNGVTADIISLTASMIVVTVPPSINPVGGSDIVVPVVVSANGGSSNVVNFTVHPGFPVPVITSLDPSGALVNSTSASITINGKNFATQTAGAFVRFATSKPALQVINSTKATMTLTSDLLSQVGTFPVTFVNPGNTMVGENGSNTVQFVVSHQVSTQPPEITSINPSQAQVNQHVTITGTNFDPINVVNNVVRFNGVVATQIISVTGTQIVVNVPVGATSGPVTVTTSGLVSNSVNFTVVQMAPLRNVPVGISPTRVVFDPVLNQALVTNADSNSVSFVDVANGILVKDIQVGGQNPVGIATYGRLAIVANYAPPAFRQHLMTVFDLDTQSIQTSINIDGLGASAFNVAIDTSTGNAVVTDAVLHIGILNLVTKQITSYFVSTPYDVAIYNPSSDTDWAIITDSSENKLVFFDLQTQVQRTAISVGLIPQGVAINPRTGIAVVVASGDNAITLVDLNTQTVVGTIPVGLRPSYVAIDSTRNRAIVSNNGEGTISVIDLASKTVIATLPTGGNNPVGVAVSEIGNLAIVANQNSGNVGLVALP
jgi:YVTN family beta-propeller protein